MADSQTRWLIAAVELCVVLVAWARLRPDRRHSAATWLAAGWALPASALCGIVEARAGWSPDSPLQLLILRTLLLGPIPALCLRAVPLTYLAGVALAFYLAFLHFSFGLSAVTTLAVEGLLAILIFVPAQLFARWTMREQHLAARSFLHPIFHAALLLGVLPGSLVALGAASWSAPLHRVSWANKIYLQLLLLPGVLLISAVQEFAQRGRGTPMPADPPRRLVTSGVYAYIANPMQVGKVAIVAGWGLFWGNYWLLAAAIAGLAYSVFVASGREDRDMEKRFPQSWSEYRRHVARWWPRWKPYHPFVGAADSAPARLYLDMGCHPCRQLASWLEGQHPSGLVILSIQHSSFQPERLTYDPGNGDEQDFGIMALGRALEHLNLACAFVGWMVRLPGIALLAQLLADALDPRTKSHCNLPARISQTCQ